MRLSKKKIKRNIERQIYQLLYQVVADIHSADEAETFLDSILTSTELEALSKRMAVARFLDKGLSYDEIKNTLKVSSATVASVAEQLKKEEGFKIALEKIRADEWAEKWSKKLNQIFSLKNSS